MSGTESLSDPTPTISFAQFWDWLVLHPNCIVRAGSRDAVLYDDEDFHWHLAGEGGDTALVQVIRGKRLVGEMLIAREDIAYVQGVVSDQESEFIFELVSGGENEQLTAYFFVLTHGFEPLEMTDSRRVH